MCLNFSHSCDTDITIDSGFPRHKVSFFLKIVLYLHSNCTVFVFGGANDDGEGSVELCLPTSV